MDGIADVRRVARRSVPLGHQSDVMHPGCVKRTEFADSRLRKSLLAPCLTA